MPSIKKIKKREGKFVFFPHLCAASVVSQQRPDSPHDEMSKDSPFKTRCTRAVARKKTGGYYSAAQVDNKTLNAGDGGEWDVRPMSTRLPYSYTNQPASHKSVRSLCVCVRGTCCRSSASMLTLEFSILFFFFTFFSLSPIRILAV